MNGGRPGREEKIYVAGCSAAIIVPTTASHADALVGIETFIVSTLQGTVPMRQSRSGCRYLSSAFAIEH